MWTVDNPVEKCVVNNVDRSCEEKAVDYSGEIPGSFPQRKARYLQYLGGKGRNLHTYSYY